MIDIIRLLNENKDITDYKVNGLKRTSYESFYVKNAVTVAPYLSQCENVLTLLRDMGVLKCIN